MKSHGEPQWSRREKMKLNISDALLACTILVIFGGVAYVAIDLAMMF